MTDKKKGKTISLKPKAKLASIVAANIVKTMSGEDGKMPLKDAASYINGCFVVMLYMMKELKESSPEDERPKVDLMLMGWIQATEPGYGDGLSRYLDKEAIERDMEKCGDIKE